MVKKKCDLCNTKINENDFVACGSCYQHTIVNAVLAYMACYQHRSSSMQLKMAVSAFYDEKSIEEAKQALIQGISKLSLQLGGAEKDRQNSTSRTAKEANIDDIIHILKLIDQYEATGNAEHKVPTFCVQDVTTLPPTAPEAAGSLMTMFEIISRQEKQIADLQATMTSIRADVQKHNDLLSVRNSQVSAPVTYAGNQDDPSQTYAERVRSFPHPVQRDRQTGPIVQQQRAEDPSKRQPNTESWQLVAPRQKTTNRKDAPKKSGSAETSDILVTGPSKFQVQITNVNEAASEDALREYIVNKDDSIEVVSIEDTSSAGWETKRFMLTFKMVDYNKVMTEEFWPKKIYFKRWYPSRRKPAAAQTNDNKDGSVKSQNRKNEQ